MHAEDSVLGQHKIDLRLKPLPAAEVLNLLAVRSKSVAQLPASVADRGRPWTVEGADQLDGIVIAVNFSATPVQQVVDETLGCIGFGYTEHDDLIVIEKQAHSLPPDRCRSVTRVAASLATPLRSAPEKQYSWHLQSISALDFLEMFASESGLNIVWPYPQTNVLRSIMLRVDVAEMREDDVLKSLLGCIGWEYERTNGGVSAFRADAPPASGKCHGFAIL